MRSAGRRGFPAKSRRFVFHHHMPFRTLHTCFSTPQPLTTDNAIGAGRVALAFEYDGRGFHGWQFQKSGVRSVQAELTQSSFKGC